MFINEVTESERVLKLPIVDSLAYHRGGGVKVGSTYSVDSSLTDSVTCLAQEKKKGTSPAIKS